MKHRVIRIAAPLCVAVALSMAAFPALGGYGYGTPTCFGEKATISDHSGTIQGTSGNDVIIGDNGTNKIFGKGGKDRICAKDGPDRVEGGGDFDRIDGGAGDELPAKPAEPGADEPVLIGGSGPDTIFGGGGDDAIHGFGGNDRIYSGDGTDSIYAGPGDDQAYGQTGNDRIITGRGSDKAYGNKGEDHVKTVDSVPGNDVADGGPNDVGQSDHCVIDDDGYGKRDDVAGCETVEEVY